MDTDTEIAVLWGDNKQFAILWVPALATIANIPETRGDARFPSGPEMKAYKETLARYRDEGHAIISCLDARSQQLSSLQVAELIRSGQVSWEPHTYWDWEGVGASSGDSKLCRFDSELSRPDSITVTQALAERLKEDLPAETWEEILPLLPLATEGNLAQLGRLRRSCIPCLIVFVLAALIIAGITIAYVASRML